MNDALAGAFDVDGVEEEADEITVQVLAELGLQLDGRWPKRRPHNFQLETRTRWTMRSQLRLIFGRASCRTYKRGRMLYKI